MVDDGAQMQKEHVEMTLNFYILHITQTNPFRYPSPPPIWSSHKVNPSSQPPTHHHIPVAHKLTLFCSVSQKKLPCNKSREHVWWIRAGRHVFYAAVGIMRNINGNPSERTFCQHLTSMSLYAPNPGHHPEWMNQQEFRTGRQYKTSTEAEEEKWLLALQSHHFHFIIWWQDGVEKLNSNQSGRKFHFSYSDSPAAPEFLAFRYMYCPQIYISVFTSAG